MTCSGDAGAEHVILINVFKIEPARQQDLVELLTRAIEGSERLEEMPHFMLRLPARAIH